MDDRYERVRDRAARAYARLLAAEAQATPTAAPDAEARAIFGVTGTEAEAREKVLRDAGYLRDPALETWMHPRRVRGLDALIATTMTARQTAVWVADGEPVSAHVVW